MENKITYTVTVNNKGGSEAETILAETVAFENNKLEVVLRILEDWLSRVESYRWMALDDSSHLDDVVAVTIDVELDEDEISEVEYRLNCFIDDDDCEPDETEYYDNQGISLARKIEYDRDFSETYEYEKGVLRVSTGFEEKYFAFGGDYQLEFDKDNYRGAMEACEEGVFWDVEAGGGFFKEWYEQHENVTYYQDLMETGWDPEADIK